MSCTARAGSIRQHAEEIVAGDVHAAGEAVAAVDDEHLLVAAQVDERHLPGRRFVQEAGGRNAGRRAGARGTGLLR